ncbi:outer membrane protein [Candidatus Lariskella endosymbiont of Epinotia ramella]|uniref:outer membrane protein n=1 Tax=Candidatus Lariskella endosymbiont of Epinotia ramella TaxID=3066224 RepID=UPI0030CCBD0A
MCFSKYFSNHKLQFFILLFALFQVSECIAKFYGKIDYRILAPLKFSDNEPLDKNGFGYLEHKPNIGNLYSFGVGKVFGNFRGEIEVSSFNVMYENYITDITVASETQLKQVDCPDGFLQNIASPPQCDFPVQVPLIQVTGYEKQNISGNLAMANFYYDIAKFSKVTPYLGAGLGVAMNTPGDFTVTADKHNWIYKGERSNRIAYSLAFGFRYDISDRVAIDLGYTYYDAGKIRTSKPDYIVLPQYDGSDSKYSVAPEGASLPLSTSLHMHSIKLGLNMNF